MVYYFVGSHWSTSSSCVNSFQKNGIKFTSVEFLAAEKITNTVFKNTPLLSLKEPKIIFGKSNCLAPYQ